MIAAAQDLPGDPNQESAMPVASFLKMVSWGHEGSEVWTVLSFKTSRKGWLCLRNGITAMNKQVKSADSKPGARNNHCFVGQARLFCGSYRFSLHSLRHKLGDVTNLWNSGLSHIGIGKIHWHFLIFNWPQTNFTDLEKIWYANFFPCLWQFCECIQYIYTVFLFIFHFSVSRKQQEISTEQVLAWQAVTKNCCVTHVKTREYANLVSNLLAYLISAGASWFNNSILSRLHMLLQKQFRIVILHYLI